MIIELEIKGARVIISGDNLSVSVSDGEPAAHVKPRPRAVDEIFAKLGGTGAVARIIEVKHSAASEMRRRGSIPVRYWPQLIDGARAAEPPVKLDSDMLMSVHAGTVSQESAA